LWKTPDKKTVGVGANNSDVLFERVEMVEITGAGSKTR
jgi:hypothetical protein